VLYYLSHDSSPFYSSYFLDRVSNFGQGWAWDHNPSTEASCLAGMTGVGHHAGNTVRWISPLPREGPWLWHGHRAQQESAPRAGPQRTPLFPRAASQSALAHLILSSPPGSFQVHLGGVE
jgi:hypothetical protein